MVLDAELFYSHYTSCMPRRRKGQFKQEALFRGMRGRGGKVTKLSLVRILELRFTFIGLDVAGKPATIPARAQWERGYITIRQWRGEEKVFQVSGRQASRKINVSSHSHAPFACHIRTLMGNRLSLPATT